MFDRRYAEEEYIPTGPAACSAEPFHKPDHKAKRHPKPRNVDCRGRFALARRTKASRVLAEIGGAE